ncbi:subtilisin-like protein [Thozetella sp. PMI_491]|nr:subtilisin-like protein [Thozetella sp. PMI_491]
MQNVDQLESTLLSVSTPGGADYGKFKDVEELQSTFAPSAEAIDSVTAWLKARGISNYKVDGAFIDFATDIATANRAFNASYQHFTSGDVTKLRTLSYSIPDEIQQHVVFLDPSTYFGQSTAQLPSYLPTTRVPVEVIKPRAEPRAEPRADTSCSTAITPACLKEMYNMGDYAPEVSSGSRVAFTSFLNQSSLQSDVDVFADLFEIPRQTIAKVLLEGGVDDKKPADGNYGEADLDAENIIGLAHPLPVTEFITGGSPPFIPDIDEVENSNEPYVPFFRYLLSKPNSELPQVISMSYADIEATVPYDYAVLTCTLIGLQGLRGITVLGSSGDIGVGAGCLNPDNKTVEFNPMFPASCPYITSIGGTQAVEPEVAWAASSGGFSKYFPRPLYQQVAVSDYLKQVDKDTIQYYSNYTNFNGRGIPDISAHSGSPWFQVIYNGQKKLSGGTSASAPVVGALVALLNDARLRAGKSTLGWLNPLLYTFGTKALIDITEGQSIGCDGLNAQNGEAEPAAGVVPWANWNATEGWDPVTGYGVPDFQKLKNLVLEF